MYIDILCINRFRQIMRIIIVKKQYLKPFRECPRSVMFKAMDGAIVVSEFVLQLPYYVHFKTNNLGK